jgi:hypothetical protein
LQGYLELVGKKTLRQMLALPIFAKEIALHHSTRLLVARGTAEHNKRYICGPYTKRDGTAKECDDFPIIFGKFSKSRAQQGKRNDWEGFRDMIKAGATTEELLEAFLHLAMPHIAKIPTWRRVYMDVPKERDWKTRVVICVGPPRAGKTTWVDQLAKQEAATYGQRPYFKADPDKWWPEYYGHQVVTIHECHGGYFQWHQLLKTVDTGPLIVQSKGDSTAFVARTIYMTSNDHPAFWYKKPRSDAYRAWDDSNAFRARIAEFGEVWLFKAPTQEEKIVDGVLVLGPKVYHPPVRDLDLAQPPDPDAESEYGQSQEALQAPRKKNKRMPYSGRHSENLGNQLASVLQAFVRDAVEHNKRL